MRRPDREKAPRASWTDADRGGATVMLFPGCARGAPKQRREYGLTPKDVFVRLDLAAITADADCLRHAGVCLQELGAKFIQAAATGELLDGTGAHRAVRLCSRRIRGLDEPASVLVPVAKGRRLP